MTRLEQLRTRRHVGQLELAKIVAIPQARLQRFEAGGAQPEDAELAVLCTYLGWPLRRADELVQAVPEPEKKPTSAPRVWRPGGNPA